MKGEHMKEYEVRKLIMKSEALNASDKLVLLAMILKVDWSTYQGRVSAREISKLISTGERSVKRTLSKLIKLGIISRESKKVGPTQNEPALTTLHIDKIDTSGKINTSGKKDTSGKLTTPPSGKLATQTISNNNKQYSNSLIKRKWGSMEEGEGYTEEIEEDEREINQVYAFQYPSSILDPEERLKAENHVKANYHRLSYTDRERIMFPDLTKPLI
tara:strand:- start:129 stop:776 length:648 start_codon:yes stop_codon:yes gene_type:complete